MTPKPYLRWWLGLGALALCGNVAWEMGQMPLYAASHPLPGCLRAAVVDALVTLAAVLAARRVAAGRRGWFWAVLLGSLLAVAATIEAWALAGARWAYSSAMPTVAAVGLVPLVQLALIAAAIVVTDRFARSRARAIRAA